VEHSTRLSERSRFDLNLKLQVSWSRQHQHQHQHYFICCCTSSCECLLRSHCLHVGSWQSSTFHCVHLQVSLQRWSWVTPDALHPAILKGLQGAGPRAWETLTMAVSGSLGSMHSRHTRIIGSWRPDKSPAQSWWYDRWLELLLLL
jgi:hypothetical protein